MWVVCVWMVCVVCVLGVGGMCVLCVFCVGCVWVVCVCVCVCVSVCVESLQEVLWLQAEQQREEAGAPGNPGAWTSSRPSKQHAVITQWSGFAVLIWR